MSSIRLLSLWIHSVGPVGFEPTTYGLKVSHKSAETKPRTRFPAKLPQNPGARVPPRKLRIVKPRRVRPTAWSRVNRDKDDFDRE